MPMCSKCIEGATKRHFLSQIMDPLAELDSTFNYNPETKSCLLTLHSPDDSIYEGRIFIIDFKLPRFMGAIPPQIRFITQCVHPYISADGSLSSNFFQEIWNKFPHPSWAQRVVFCLKEVLKLPDLEKAPVEREEFQSQLNLFLKEYAT